MLYEEQALARYELISTVSGGGYPVYGLLVRMTQYGVALSNLLSEVGRCVSTPSGAIAQMPG